MEMDEEVLLGMNKNPEELAREMRLAAAVKWYEMGMISQERAAQLSGMSRAAFITALSNFGASPFQETSEEILGTLDKSEK
jgi:predicted HTH domain antitoxin